MTFSPITDFVEREVEKLFSQFNEKPKIVALLGSFTKTIQDAEDALAEVLAERLLGTAIGVQLDVIGRIVGRGRAGLSDDDYRVTIRVQIRINRSSGLTEDLLDVARLALTPGTLFRLVEHDPAQARIVVDSAIIEDPNLVFSLLKSAKAAGVKFFLEYTVAEPIDTFTMARDVSPPEFSTTQGYGDAVAGLVGGKYASVVG